MIPLSSNCLSILFATLMVMLNLVAMTDGVTAFIPLSAPRVSSSSSGGILTLLTFLVPGLLPLLDILFNDKKLECQV